MVSPEQWLSNFEATIASVRERAAEFEENLASAGATESSEDGAVRVSVAPNGSLTELSIADSALRGSGSQLAEQIMRLARKAQRAAAVRVTEAFAPLAGEDSESLRMVTGFVPPPEPEPEPPSPAARFGFTDDHTESESPPPAPPRRPPPNSMDDDGDFSDDDPFGRQDRW